MESKVGNSTSQFETQSDREIESTILSHFESCGVDESDYEILSVKELKCTSIEDFLIEDDNAQKQLHKFAAIPNLSATDMAILEQVQNNPNASIKDLSRALKLPDDVVHHQAILAYASDMGLLSTSMNPHKLSFAKGNVMSASLDHAMWFHRPFRADEWMLYSTDSPSASNARGFNRGSVYTEDGTLVASAVQEGLMRVVKK